MLRAVMWQCVSDSQMPHCAFAALVGGSGVGSVPRRMHMSHFLPLAGGCLRMSHASSELWSQPCPNALPNAHTPSCFQAKTMLPTHCVNFNSVATSQPFRSGSQAFRRKVSASDMPASTNLAPDRFLQWDLTRNQWLESAWLDRVVHESVRFIDTILATNETLYFCGS